jgi:signal transduction histidine kinase
MNLFKKIVLMLATAALCVTAFAAERGSPEEAKAMLAKAVAYYKANGKEKSIAQFNDKAGSFVDRDLYISVIDLQGNTLAHAFNPRLLGKNNLAIEDADGKLFYKDRLEIVKAKGRGQQEYKVINPVTKAIEHKVAYFEKVDDVVLTTGTFRQ